MANERYGFSRYVLFLKGKLVFFLLYRIIMRFADHSFVQSKQMLNDVAGYGIPAERMTPVPMGVPKRLLDWASARQTDIVAGRIVYIGTMASVRRLDVLVNAFAIVHARYPQTTLLMVGDGDHPNERSTLEDQVATLGLIEATCFTGFVPIEEAWSYAASAAVCLSPFFPTKILASTSPTKLVEYMALGRPVVCNDHPEQSEIIKESGAGLCVNWGVQEFAEAMIWMLEHPKEAEAMGAKGPAWVSAHRTYTIIAENVWRKYQEILSAAV
jgi:glycosyltransferase involved in cell wall biosynthesis